jgi:hypothetical protein
VAATKTYTKTTEAQRGEPQPKTYTKTTEAQRGEPQPKTYTKTTEAQRSQRFTERRKGWKNEDCGLRFAVAGAHHGDAVLAEHAAWSPSPTGRGQGEGSDVTFTLAVLGTGASNSRRPLAALFERTK